MPSKLPKVFQRRKSSGNALDDVQAVEPSFKVYTRPSSSGQSLDMMTSRKKPLPVLRNSFELEDDDLFTATTRNDATNRGSGGTENSLSTAPYDSGASSSRLSTTSTNPSSIDTKSDKNIQSANQRPFNDIPVPPQHQQRNGVGFLRNAGRTFSFGVKQQKAAAESDLPPVPSHKTRFSVSNGRERAMTTSSVSTTTPPRLPDANLVLNTSELDGFENMFDTIGARSSREPSPSRPSAAQKSPIYSSGQSHLDNGFSSKNVASRPLNINKTAKIESSPYSWVSETSRDGLVQSPSPSRTVMQHSPQTEVARNPLVNSRDLPPQPADLKIEENLFADTPSRARAYSRPNRPTGPPPSSFPAQSRANNLSQSSSTIKSPTISLASTRDQEDSVLDPSLLASAALATKYQETKPAMSEPMKKVMTPQQFERYRQQENERQRLNKAFGKTDSDESGDDYDDDEEDEIERDRQASKQRRKQEAHLAVYRQTMRKVTGEVLPSGPADGSHPGTAHNSTDLSNKFSNLNFDSSSKSPGATTDEEDEDEDVPLGILAAHGFPNKNRPPVRLTSSGSSPNLRGMAQSQIGGASVAGESVHRGSLPAFARKLPEDPYFGAGLVNPSNRESLAFHSTPNLLSPSGAHTNHPHHPAGLVGVIAGEERARAARRGSPNMATGQFELPPSMPQQHPGMMRSQTMGQISNNMMMPGMQGMAGMPGTPGTPGMMGMPGMPPMLSPGDHAQIQMSQQMTQMMQMQMQWMQSMQQFMSNGGPPPPPGMPSGPVDPMTMGMQRPQSVPLQSYGQPGQRSMSTLSPNMANWNHQIPPLNLRPGSTYAPSIAPSERSNVGLASRYRPVSTVHEPTTEMPWQKRASTMTSSTFQPWSSSGTTKQPATQTVRRVAMTADEDDDEAGWAEMKAKKEKKQKSWKLRKGGNNPLQELHN